MGRIRRLHKLGNVSEDTALTMEAEVSYTGGNNMSTPRDKAAYISGEIAR
jgi:hypothetical protein